MQETAKPTFFRWGVSVTVAVAIVQFVLVWTLWARLGATISFYLALVAVLYGVNGVLNISRLGRAKLLIYSASYVALFVFFMVILGGTDTPDGHFAFTAPEHRALIFTIFTLFFGAIFHFGRPVGYIVIILFSYFVVPNYALPAALMLSVFYALSLRVIDYARKNDNYLLMVFFFVSFIFAMIVFFPLLHFMLQRQVQDLAKVLFDSEISRQVQQALGTSVLTSTIATAIALLLGTPLAYVLVRADFKGRSIIDVAIDIPILIPAPILGIAILMLLGSNASLGREIQHFGNSIAEMLGGPHSLLGSIFHNIKFDQSILGIILVQVLVSSPFFIRSAMTAFRGVDARLEYVSRTLGAGPLKTFLSITLPLAARGMFTGCILAWARGISEFGAVQLVAYSPKTGPTLIYDLYQGGGTDGPAPTVAIIMALLCLSIFIVLHLLGRKLLWRRA